MRILLFVFLFLFSFRISAQQDTAHKQRKLCIGVYSAASYQFAVNGTKAKTDLGNFAFKGYLQPEIGLGVRFQQDSSEFALITLSTSRLVFTLASTNRIIDNGNEYPIMNRMDLFMNNYSLEASYHRRICTTKSRNYFSLECGAGIHVINWSGITHSVDTTAGPYHITRSFETGKELYAVPSATIGFNFTTHSSTQKTEFILGLRGQLYLAKFAEINYKVQYTSPNATLNYYFRWSPVILSPKAFVMVVF